MSSHESFPLEALDLLIVEALQAEVGDAEPSPRVWERIRLGAKAWAARQRLRRARYWNEGPTHVRRGSVPSSSLLAIVGCGVTGWGCDTGTVRFLDCYGLAFRFGY